jgi:nucleoside 2-deoxyribosyltransferase
LKGFKMQKKVTKAPPHGAVRAYLASPLGFADSTRQYMYQTLIPVIEDGGVIVVNPWDLTTEEEVMAVRNMTASPERNRALHTLNMEIGRRNRLAIDVCDIVIASLDGQELDSGTVGEVCYMIGRGNPSYGLRTDFRQSGEEGAIVNLQIKTGTFARFLSSSPFESLMFHTTGNSPFNRRNSSCSRTARSALDHLEPARCPEMGLMVKRCAENLPHNRP